jgi:BlaI family penicillinase repressor
MLILTPTEERIMLFLWKIEPAKLNDIIQCFPDPKPAQNAMSTMLNILKKKGFVVNIRESRSYVYSAKISKLEYASVKLKLYLQEYFNGDLVKLKKHVDILDL